jgi:hypothetical protein
VKAFPLLNYWYTSLGENTFSRRPALSPPDNPSR